MLVFSIDPGTNSAGWAVFELIEGHQIIPVATGVRLFGTAGSGRYGRERSLKDRHRYRRRTRTRRRQLVRLLLETGYLPADKDARQRVFELDPYEIRMRGLTHPLSDHEFGRCICHIAKRRGLADGQSEDILPTSAHGYPTWGAWLWSRHAGPPQDRLPVRNRLSLSAAIQVDLAPPRRALEHEFDILWEVQASFRADGLPAELAVRIRNILFQCEKPHRSNARTPVQRNPLVRVAVNQMYKLVKAMILAYGSPALVVIENSASTGVSMARHASETRPRSEGRSLQTSKRSRKRLSLLWRQQLAAGGKAFCPYTGIYLDRSLALSSLVQIDHIVPFCRTGDNEPDNLVLCLADANRAKAGRTPYEAFGSDRRWQEIIDRARHLPEGNRQRLLSKRGPGATLSDFGRHQPHAMRQIVRQISQIVENLCPSTTIELVDPKATALARNRLGLMACLGPNKDNSAKNRSDHRHHAVDAIAAGLAAIDAGCGRVDRAGTLPQIVRMIQSVTVSAKPRHGASGPMHKQTIYGMGDARNKAVYRKPLAELTNSEIGCVRDPCLRAQLQTVVEGQAVAMRRKLLVAHSGKSGIRRVRLVRNLATGIQLADKATGKMARIVQPMANHHMDIVADRDGGWHAYGATTHAIRQPDWRPCWEKPGCGFKLVMRLRKSDAVEIDNDHGERVIRRVARLAPSCGRIYLADPNAAGNLAARHADPDDSFRWEILNAETLHRRRARAVRIDVLGRCSYRKSNFDARPSSPAQPISESPIELLCEPAKVQVQTKLAEQKPQ